VFWRRTADESNALESPRCDVDSDVRDPASSGSAVAPTRLAESTWRPTLDKSDAWRFNLEIWTDPWNDFRFTLIEEGRSGTAIHWRIDVESPNGGVVYQARLTGSATSKQL
jgi:hypothetical protein